MEGLSRVNRCRMRGRWDIPTVLTLVELQYPGVETVTGLVRLTKDLLKGHPADDWCDYIRRDVRQRRSKWFDMYSTKSLKRYRWVYIKVSAGALARALNRKERDDGVEKV